MNVILIIQIVAMVLELIAKGLSESEAVRKLVVCLMFRRVL